MVLTFCGCKTSFAVMHDTCTSSSRLVNIRHCDSFSPISSHPDVHPGLKNEPPRACLPIALWSSTAQKFTDSIRDDISCLVTDESRRLLLLSSTCRGVGQISSLQLINCRIAASGSLRTLCVARTISTHLTMHVLSYCRDSIRPNIHTQQSGNRNDYMEMHEIFNPEIPDWSRLNSLIFICRILIHLSCNSLCLGNRIFFILYATFILLWLFSASKVLLPSTTVGPWSELHQRNGC
jgi:hypothetical protein